MHLPFFFNFEFKTAPFTGIMTTHNEAKTAFLLHSKLAIFPKLGVGFLFYCVLFFCCSICGSQQTISAQNIEPLPLPTRVELRTGVSLRAGLGKKLQTTLSFQLRGDDNYEQTTDQFFGELGFSYEATKFMNLLGSYRYIYRFANTPKHRFFSGFSFNHRLKPFDLSARFLLQTDLRPHKPERFTPRLQFSAQYDRKKNPFKPRLAAEFFYRFDYKYHIFSRYRLIAELAYMPRKTPHILSLAYMYERNLNIGTPNVDHIANLSYRYDLGNLLPKKKNKGKNK